MFEILMLSFTYRIIPNRGNGLEINNLEPELILPVFKSKFYHY